MRISPYDGNVPMDSAVRRTIPDVNDESWPFMIYYVDGRSVLLGNDGVTGAVINARDAWWQGIPAIRKLHTFALNGAPMGLTPSAGRFLMGNGTQGGTVSPIAMLVPEDSSHNAYLCVAPQHPGQADGLGGSWDSWDQFLVEPKGPWMHGAEMAATRLAEWHLKGTTWGAVQQVAPTTWGMFGSYGRAEDWVEGPGPLRPLLLACRGFRHWHHITHAGIGALGFGAFTAGSQIQDSRLESGSSSMILRFDSGAIKLIKVDFAANADITLPNVAPSNGLRKVIYPGASLALYPLANGGEGGWNPK